MNMSNNVMQSNNPNLARQSFSGYAGMPVGQPMYMGTPTLPLNNSPSQGYDASAYLQDQAPIQSYASPAPYGAVYGSPELGFPYPPRGTGPFRQTNLQQFADPYGTNNVGADAYNGNATISQLGNNAYRQSFAINQGTGNLQLQQLGGAYGDNTSQIGAFNGNLNQFSYNNQGGNQIDYSNLYGRNTLATFANGNSFNQVNLNNVQNGVRYLTSGNTNLNVDNSPNASVLISGDDDKSSSYYVRIANSYGTKKNSIIMNMDGSDRATIDLSQARNNSEIFLNGSGRSASIASRNGMKDTIYLDEGTQIDYSNMDDFDTIIIKNNDGGLRSFQAGTSKNTSYMSPLLQGTAMYEASNPGATQMNLSSLFGSTYSNNVQLGRVISAGQNAPSNTVVPSSYRQNAYVQNGSNGFRF